MKREPSRLVTTYELVSTACPTDWGDQYLLTCAIRDDVMALYDAGVESCDASAVNDRSQFAERMIFDADAVLAATGGGYPFVFVMVWFVTAMFDVALLDPIIAKYQLVVARKYRFDQPTGGGELLP